MGGNVTLDEEPSQGCTSASCTKACWCCSIICRSRESGEALVGSLSKEEWNFLWKKCTNLLIKLEYIGL
jgi:hypothetical protein